MGYNVIVAGATGQIGRQIIRELQERNFAVKKLLLFASEDSVGDAIEFMDEDILVQQLDDTVFSGADLVFFCTPACVACSYMQAAVSAGAFCIDLSGAVHTDIQVYPRVAEMSSALHIKQCSAVCSPAPPAVQAALLLNALGLEYPLKSACLTAFRSVSSLGSDAVDVLRKQSADLLNGRPVATEDVLPVFPHQLAYNVTPLGEDISACLDTATTSRHIREVLDQPEFSIGIAQFMLPVFYGDGLSLQCSVDAQVDRAAIVELLSRQPGIEVYGGEEAGILETCAAAELNEIGVVVTGADAGRITLWSTIDNLRKGSALNAVQLAEQRFGVEN